MRTLIRQTSSMVMAFPGLVVAICMMAVLGQGFWPLVARLGLLIWPVFARVLHAEASGILARDYVTAARLPPDQVLSSTDCQARPLGRPDTKSDVKGFIKAIVAVVAKHVPDELTRLKIFESLHDVHARLINQKKNVEITVDGGRELSVD